MNKDKPHFLTSLPNVLSAIHLLLFLITILTGKSTATDGNPFVCVDLPVSLPLVARDDTWTVVAVGILGTGWWYFLGKIGSSSRQGKLSRGASVLGAFLILLMCAADGYGMISQFPLISREPEFSIVDIAIYIVAAILLFGGVFSAALAALAVFRSDDR